MDNVKLLQDTTDSHVKNKVEQPYRKKPNGSTNPTLIQVNRFTGVLQKKQEKNGSCRFIIFASQIDPDAIGSSIGMSEILKSLGYLSTMIVYAGAIGHPQNKAIFNHFGLSSRFCHTDKYKAKEGDVFILMDSSTAEDRRLPQELKIDPYIVIDHHRIGTLPEETEDRFYWIEDIGSTSTLVVELGIALEVKFSRIALITLALGIFTDTKDLKFIAKKRDAPAYLWLINSEEDINDDLTELQDFKLPISYFDHLRYALSHMAISGPKFITSLGIISKDDGDNLAIIADELLKAEGINLVVVFAIIGRHIRVSARSSDSALSLDDYLKGIFGAECSGAKSLYGGYSEGGALIEFFNMSWVDSTKTPEESKAFVFSQMRSKIFPTNSEN